MSQHLERAQAVAFLAQTGDMSRFNFSFGFQIVREIHYNSYMKTAEGAKEIVKRERNQ